MVGMVTRMLGLKNITGEIEAYKETRSIAGTVKELFRSGNGIVAFLVMLFSIIIPVTKILLLLLGTYFQELMISRKSLSINNAISKWSMADVFVIAIIVPLGSTTVKLKSILELFQFRSHLIRRISLVTLNTNMFWV